jgi:chaperonin GroES
MKKTTIQPLGVHVLVEFEKKEQKTDSGIYLPETASQEKPQQGIVVAVGESDKIVVKKGQKVIFRPFSGIEIESDGREFVMVKSEDIVAVIEE